MPGRLHEVFAFFEDPRNLAELTPPWLNFQVREATDERVREGTRIRYTIRWQGLPMRWESVIARYEPGRCFADEMVKGPYRTWYHLHSFRQLPNGVEISDRVDYSMPLGPLGAMAHSLVVRRQLEAIFSYRERRVRERFGPAPVA